MSNHKIDVIKIENIEKHPNADSLGIVRIGGYTCCVRLADWEPIIPCLAAYIIPDSIVPTNRPEFAFLKDKGEEARIKVMRLRGVYSQGLLVPVSHLSLNEGDDAAEVLGVMHYEPPIPMSTGGESEQAPGRFAPHYDVENFNRYAKVGFQNNEEVIATEKIHGANLRAVWHDDRLHMGSRTEWKKQNDENLWWRGIANHPEIQTFLQANPDCTVYGEVCGMVKGFPYGCAPGKVRILLFDILRGNEWLSWDESQAIASEYKLPWVPLIYRGPFEEMRMRELAEGNTTVPEANHIREGIVIKPVKERTSLELGRVQLKIVSNKYLEKS